MHIRHSIQKSGSLHQIYGTKQRDEEKRKEERESKEVRARIAK